MAPTTPTGEPARLVAGDSWRWRIADLASYPQSESWSLKYQLLGASARLIEPTFQTSGDDVNHWLVSVATSVTDDVTAGRYELVKYVVGSGAYAGRQETLKTFVVEVLPDPRTSADGDRQTHAEKTLAVIEAAIEGRLSKDLESYSVRGRQITKIPIRDLFRLRAQYAAIVRAERRWQVTRPVRGVFQKVGV